jgi:kynurenine formamidase
VVTERLPSYHELPVAAGAPPGSSWGVWGRGDVFGCLNLLTPEATRRGLAAARKGSVFSLNLELELPDPPLFDRSAFRHTVTALASFASEETLSDWNTQASSQWDGFRHVRSPVYGAYGGIDEAHHGLHHWARRGIVTRGVVADVARWRQARGRPIAPGDRDVITPADLLATLQAQGTTVEPGDILLVRTGWLAWYRGLDPGQRIMLAGGPLTAAGLEASEATAQTLWDLHTAAVATDNPAVEAWPPPLFLQATPPPDEEFADPARSAELFLHVHLLPLLGLPLGELFDLDTLAADCAADGTWDCLFTSAPLNLHHGVASSPNALAIR